MSKIFIDVSKKIISCNSYDDLRNVEACIEEPHADKRYNCLFEDVPDGQFPELQQYPTLLLSFWVKFETDHFVEDQYRPDNQWLVPQSSIERQSIRLAHKGIVVQFQKAVNVDDGNAVTREFKHEA